MGCRCGRLVAGRDREPGGAKRLAEFARRLAAAGQVPLAKVQFGKAQALYEKSLEGDPESDLVAAELAQLLWDKEELRTRLVWTVLKPTEMKSAGGATLSLSVVPDGSILASGENPAARSVHRHVVPVEARHSVLPPSAWKH